MQIEQAIGGVGGDATAQAIQLRMRANGQPLVSQGRIRAWDSAGQNPVMIIDFTTDVSGANVGDHVLICSPGFLSKTTPLVQADFIMTNLIPASYLAAGRLTFENNSGIVLWSLAWGPYTGSNTGVTVNDMDGNFGPAWGWSLPSSEVNAVYFTGPATAPSTTNAADYALTPGAAVFTNNAGASFTVVNPCSPPSISEHPQPGLTRVGRSFSFSVVASGTGPVSYQWRKDTVDLNDDSTLTGAHTPTLMLTDVQLDATASYDVVVSNSCGTATSDAATLSVFCPADFDLNTFVNGDDFDLFSWAFEQGDISADFDENTFVNGDDFDGFSWAFFEGC